MCRMWWTNVRKCPGCLKFVFLHVFCGVNNGKSIWCRPCFQAHLKPSFAMDSTTNPLPPSDTEKASLATIRTADPQPSLPTGANSDPKQSPSDIETSPVLTEVGKTPTPSRHAQSLNPSKSTSSRMNSVVAAHARNCSMNLVVVSNVGTARQS